MRTALGLALALLAGGASLGAADPPKGGAAPAEDVQDVLFMAQGQPLLFRLHLRVDGRPHAAAWGEYLGKLFDFLDRNGDGALDREEAGRAPNPEQLRLLFQGGYYVRNGTQLLLFEAMDRDEDGKVSRAEFVRYYLNSAAGPVQWAYGGNNPGLGGDVLTERLFLLLDADRDGKLSKEELARAPEVLAKLDNNDDEMITPQELLEGVGRDVIARQAQRRSSGRVRPLPGPPVVLVGYGESSRRLTQRLSVANHLIDNYDSDGDRKLSRAEIALPADVFDRLDANHDGKLDALELLRWSAEAPVMELTLHLGQVPSAGAVQAQAPAVKPAGDTLSAQVGGARFHFTRAPPSRVATLAGYQNFLTQQFRAADGQKRGYVTAKEVEGPRRVYLSSVLDIADRDGDGKLTEKELLAWARLATEGANRVTTVSFTDGGRGLFQLLDADGDGRLSVRELRNAWRRLAEYDRSGAGRVGREDVPTQYHFVVARGMGFRGVAAANPFAAQAPAVPVSRRGPLWFRKMDRNGDGDVSPREFLGPAADFRRIDADGDGLISADEAERYDAAVRALRQRPK